MKEKAIYVLELHKIVQVRGCKCLCRLFGGRRLCVSLSAFGSFWLALIVIVIIIVIVWDLRLLGAGCALGRGTRAGSEH